MDGLCRALSAPWACQWQGKTYWAEPLRLWALSSCETYILLQRKNPLDKIVSMMEVAGNYQDIIKDMYHKAYGEMKKDKESRLVTVEQLFDWLRSLEGIAYSAWCCLRLSKPQCLEDFQADVQKMSMEQLKSFCRARDMASGLDALANMDWRSQDDIDKLRPAHKRGQKDPAPKYMPWRRMLRGFANAYYWDNETIGNLTMYEVKTYSVDEDELGGTKKMSPAEAFAYRDQKRAMGV